MALAVTVDHEFEGFKFGTISLGAYATNGVAVAGADVACGENLVHLAVQPAGGYVFEHDAGNGKVKAYQSAAVAAHTHTENTAAAYTQNAVTVAAGAVAAAHLAEVGNGVDLSGVTARYVAFGW